MKALLWKDWRLVRPLLLAAMILYFLPMLIGGVWILMPSTSSRPIGVVDWLDTIAGGFMVGLIVSSLAAPIFGAVMFARERRERTADLVGTMPTARHRVVISKAIMLACLFAAPWAITLLGGGAFEWFAIEKAGQSLSAVLQSGWPPFMTVFAIQALAIGSGWLFSTLMDSETIAAGLSYLLSVLTPAAVLVVWSKQHPESHSVPMGLFCGVCGAVGAVCLVAGAVVALRRRSP